MTTNGTGFVKVATTGGRYTPEEVAVIADEMDGWIGHLLRMSKDGKVPTQAVIADMRNRRDSLVERARRDLES